MKNLNNVLFNFFWSSNVDKVKRKLTNQKYPYGGIKMIDLGCYIKALKSTWIRKIINDNDSKWLMLLKKIINTEKLINTGSANLEIKICIQKTNSGNILLVLIRNFKMI